MPLSHSLDEDEFSLHFLENAVELAKITKYLINPEFQDTLTAQNNAFRKMNKNFMQVLEGQPTYFKDTMMEYYVVTEKNGLIHDEHVKISDKYHNNI